MSGTGLYQYGLRIIAMLLADGVQYAFMSFVFFGRMPLFDTVFAYTLPSCS